MPISSLAAALPFDTAELINALGLLLDSALKGILLVAAAAIAAYALRNRSAAARHAAWTAAVVGHLALPAITLLAPAWRLPFLPSPPWLTATAQTIPPAPRLSGQPTTPGRSVTSTQTSATTEVATTAATSAQQHPSTPSPTVESTPIA